MEQELTAITGLAFQYGPFLFALLFTLVITRWGHNIYRQAAERVNPPASEREKETYRVYFISMAVFGTLLVIVSIVWWFMYQPAVYVFRGEIKGLRDYENVTSDSLFFRPVLLRRLEANAPQLRNEEFVVVQDKAFEPGQTFEILFSKGQGTQEQFSIAHTQDKTPKYQVQWDSNQGRSILTHTNPQHSQFSLISPVFAQPGETPPPMPPLLQGPRNNLELQDIQHNQRQLFQQSQREPPAPSSASPLVVLQKERSSVGSKIVMLEQLLASSDERLRDYLVTPSRQEPFMLTLMDLSRHTDPELSFKAKKLLQRIRPEQWLNEQLQQNTPQSQAMLEMVLPRMPAEQARRWLQDLAPESLAKLDAVNKIIAQGHSSALVPTGSVYGDRYYLQVNWPESQPDIGDCAAKIIEESDPFRTDEAVVVNRHLIYGYAKNWALHTANQLRKCGAEVSFKGMQ